ncbi:uncharacterized protein BDZ99DRAFT_514130 [Mytilinidion resinicola]|uniref:Uncharacterized protein n=1 Tax=Mytilinidion resinicola TaxID=574789 RepID=A0A6A6ZB38_9PEZI|nr:uncharacterized protein BDZ99DRAFT_514130 [Mytilinidion resinicola]KAF2817909.1 hypothetical protein BDZ99DRAFT_514130 [Mytilinidion resinicola]
MKPDRSDISRAPEAELQDPPHQWLQADWRTNIDYFELPEQTAPMFLSTIASRGTERETNPYSAHQGATSRHDSVHHGLGLSTDASAAAVPHQPHNSHDVSDTTAMMEREEFTSSAVPDNHLLRDFHEELLPFDFPGAVFAPSSSEHGALSNAARTDYPESNGGLPITSRSNLHTAVAGRSELYQSGLREDTGAHTGTGRGAIIKRKRIPSSSIVYPNYQPHTSDDTLGLAPAWRPTIGLPDHASIAPSNPTSRQHDTPSPAQAVPGTPGSVLSELLGRISDTNLIFVLERVRVCAREGCARLAPEGGPRGRFCSERCKVMNRRAVKAPLHYHSGNCEGPAPA